MENHLPKQAWQLTLRFKIFRLGGRLIFLTALRPLKKLRLASRYKNNPRLWLSSKLGGRLIFLTALRPLKKLRLASR